jgi:tellurite resistance protein TehA-like permease
MILLIITGTVFFGLCFVVFIINAQYVISQKMIKSEPAPDIHELFTPSVIAIYVAVGIFLSEQAYVRHRDKKTNNERLINTYNAILNEIKNHQKTLSSDKRVKDGKIINYAADRTSS